MATFLHDEDLNSALRKIFAESEEKLIIISPFIKLHDRLKDVLKAKKEAFKLQIVVVFGKNEQKKEKSFSAEEFKFLRDFPNIEIRYNNRLHAKYYANERSAILSSMNLYDYSQNNNIEFGILTEPSLFGELSRNLTGESLDTDAQSYFQQVISNSDLLFCNQPVFEEGGLLNKLRKKYLTFETITDDLSEVLLIKEKKKEKQDKVVNLPTEKGGFCIRTGIKIPFNPEKPLSDKAFRQWNKFKEKEYPEKYCHFSGEPSNGETTAAKPILRKNWKKAMV